MEERFGPPDFKAKKLDIKIKPFKQSHSNMLRIEILNTNCNITNLQLRINNPSNMKLSALFSGIETESGGCPTQQIIGDIESHFAVLSNFLDCAVDYEPGYINVKLGLFHNKMAYFLSPNWEHIINLRLTKPYEFYNNFNWDVRADIYINHNNGQKQLDKQANGPNTDLALYKFINPQLFSSPIVSNTINANHRINCLYLSELPGPVSLINRVKLEIDGIPVLDITPEELIQANKANGIDYPGILIVFNPQILSAIDNLVRTSYINKFNVYLDWADPEIKSDGVIGNVLSNNILQILKSGYCETYYHSEFSHFK